jgi:hypothetical protein
VIGNAAQHAGEPSLRIDIVELGGDDQRVYRRAPLAAAIGAQFLRPMAIPRRARSAALLVKQMSAITLLRLQAAGRFRASG